MFPVSQRPVVHNSLQNRMANETNYKVQHWEYKKLANSLFFFFLGISLLAPGLKYSEFHTQEIIVPEAARKYLGFKSKAKNLELGI